ncbi:transketolase [Streptomyces griseoflavus Tu4000]|uniref:Transketolase n=1 Tax=Streptomyces griseoflavus Tu4000 TaxID=467200 RepID=D9XZI8_9ACTN|nr:transketolase [Streptomyces griseoflavus Tu4000]
MIVSPLSSPGCSTRTPGSWRCSPRSARTASPRRGAGHPDRGRQCGHPGAAAGRGGGRDGPDGTAPRRAHLRQFPGRAAVRAGEAGSRAPGRGRGTGERRRLLRLAGRRVHAHGPGRRGAAGHPGGLDRACAGTSGRGRDAAAARGGRRRRQGVRAAVPAVQRTGAARGTGERLHGFREGRAGVVVAVGPMLDAVLDATEGLDLTVLYAATVRPFDAAGLRRATESAGTDVVLVEPYLAGTSTAAANDALADVPHRVLGLGVGRAELRRYGRIDEHVRAHGLDARSLRERIGAFVGAVPAGV